MCKFPFSGREFVAGREGVPYAWPRTTGRWLDSAMTAVHSLCETAAATSASPVERLRLAIDCLPVARAKRCSTAMRANERIIAGAYVDREGGVCPMLAAHRAGGRTDLLSFARSWDRFTRTGGGASAGDRRASCGS